MSDELTGIQAMLAEDKNKGGGGGGKRSATSALNAAHHVLVMADRPLHGRDLCYHIQGLGLWSSGAGKPANGVIHVLNNNAGLAADNPSRVVDKTSPSMFAARAGSTPLPITRKPVADDVAEAYATALESGFCEPLQADDDE